MEDLQRLIALSLVKGIGAHKLKSIIEYYEDLSSLFVQYLQRWFFSDNLTLRKQVAHPVFIVPQLGCECCLLHQHTGVAQHVV